MATAVAGPAGASRLPQPPPHAKHATAADPRPYAAADLAFGLDVLAAWCEREPKANVVISPASLGTGLGMAYLGARGGTATAMARTLRLPPTGPVTGVHAAGRALSSFVAGMQAKIAALRALNRPGVALLSSDHVWADPRLRAEQSYLSNVARAYRARVASAPLLSAPESARRTINAAVGQETRGLIANLLPAGSLHSDGWVLTDAMYLNADWATPFDHSSTAPGAFATAAGGTVRTPFLHGMRDYPYASADGWTAVALPYRGGRLAMVALLPVARVNGCPAIGPSVLNQVMSRLAAAPTALAMPKVRLSSKADMAVLLGSLGMGAAFGAAADFGGLSPAAGALGVVEHAATLRVDEKGTVAAAATATGVGVAAVIRHRDVVFDRPYLLLVRDTVTGEPLFLARVADPSLG
jgi:serine protease inhibitor